jgi:hypothetical protein
MPLNLSLTRQTYQLARLLIRKVIKGLRYDINLLAKGISLSTANTITVITKVKGKGVRS